MARDEVTLKAYASKQLLRSGGDTSAASVAAHSHVLKQLYLIIANCLAGMPGQRKRASAIMYMQPFFSLIAVFFCTFPYVHRKEAVAEFFMHIAQEGRSRAHQAALQVHAVEAA